MGIVNEMAKSEAAIRENHELNFALNELANIQEKCETLSERFVYEAKMIPVFEILDECGDSLYCIESDMFKKLLDSQSIPISKGLGDMFDEIHSCSDDEIEKNQMAIVFPKESIHDIQDKAVEDPEKFTVRSEQVKHYVDIMNCILDEGYRIIFI